MKWNSQEKSRTIIERFRPTTAQKEDQSENRHLHNRLGCLKMINWKPKAEDVLPLIETKIHQIWDMTEELPNDVQSELMKNSRCCMHTKTFGSKEHWGASQGLRATRKNFRLTCTPINKEVFKDNRVSAEAR